MRLLVAGIAMALALASCTRNNAVSAPAAPTAAEPVVAPVAPDAPSPDAADAPEPSAQAPASEPGAAAVADAGATPTADPLDLYNSCKERVEGRETPGECTSDADCVKAGCSGEVCVAAELAAGMMTTCEVRPCFAALDACGCVEGLCRWSLKEGPISPLPGGGRPMPVPAAPQ